MLHELRDLFKITGRGDQFILLLLLRCPFEAIRTILQANFLQFSFLAINQRHIDNLYISCGIFGIGSLLLFLYNGTIWMFFSTYVIKLEGNLRNKLFAHVSTLSLQQVDTKSSGEWFTRLNTDVQLSILSKPLHLPHAVVAFVSICVSAFILFVINPFILGLVILFLVPHLLISQLFIAKPMTAYAIKSQEATANNTTDMNAFITCADTAIIYDGWRFLLNQFEESSLNLHKSNMKIKRRRAIYDALLPIMGMGGYLTVLLIASTQISSGHMSFDELTAVFQYRVGLLTGSLMLTNCLISIKTSLAGVRRVNETMHIKLEE